jgi:hypothetical protein
MREHCKTISHPWVRTPPYYPTEGAEKIGPSGHYPFKRPVNLKVSLILQVFAIFYDIFPSSPRFQVLAHSRDYPPSLAS